MKKLLLIVILTISSFSLIEAQNLIGHNATDVRRLMKTLRPTFKEDVSIVNPKSIKYVDKTKDNTLMFFINEKGICTYQKFMLDVSCAKNAVDTLNKRFKYLDNLTWADRRNSKDYVIKMVNNEWYFTIQISEKD